jgi:hypothetical protein
MSRYTPKLGMAYRRLPSPVRTQTNSTKGLEHFWNLKSNFFSQYSQAYNPLLCVLQSSSPRSIKHTLTHTGRTVLCSGGLNQYKSLYSSWCSSHPLLQDPTLCSILLVDGKKYRQIVIWIGNQFRFGVIEQGLIRYNLQWVWRRDGYKPDIKENTSN